MGETTSRRQYKAPISVFGPRQAFRFRSQKTHVYYTASKDKSEKHIVPAKFDLIERVGHIQFLHQFQFGAVDDVTTGAPRYKDWKREPKPWRCNWHYVPPPRA